MTRNMVGDDDWRLMGQENYLQGILLRHRAWSETRPGWDHDHCAFCTETFGDERIPEALHEGWTNDTEYWWICDTCFADFRERLVGSWDEASSHRGLYRQPAFASLRSTVAGRLIAAKKLVG